MADGIAHQIKNRLNHFAVASTEMKSVIENFIKKQAVIVREQPELRKSFDYLIKVCNSVSANVTKTDNVVKGILQYTKSEEKESYFEQFSLGKAIDLAVDLLRDKHQIEEVPVRRELDFDLLWGIKPQVMEALYNLIDNAYEAIQERIAVSDREGDRDEYAPFIVVRSSLENKMVSIVVSDNGIGMHDEQSAKVFAPFFTTKPSAQSGSGIGMYVVKRIVEENHGGRILFQTNFMLGTNVTIQLPGNRI